ncbi:MAG: TolC family protein [Cyanobacteria bacterium NC_groundwater_1444_Ag_S-0.65um_54_12]|nr:TolC family protein [Cyanobacteria bacterium NC_groundwater_1444_Ag_S-0.65um_54_12]
MKAIELRLLAGSLWVLAGVVWPLPAGATPQPLTLAQAIELVSANHPNSQAVELQARQAALALADARAQRWQLSADLAAQTLYSRSGITGNVQANSDLSQPLANGTIGLSIPLFDGFKLAHSIAATERNWEVSQAQRKVTLADLRWQVTHAFWKLREAELLEESQRQTLVQTEQIQRFAKAAAAAGRKSPNEVDQAAAAVLAAQSERLLSAGKTAQARLDLASLLGSTSADLVIVGDPAQLPPNTARLENSVSTARVAVSDRQPAVAIARARLAEAASRYESSKGDRWPSVNFVTTYQHGNNPLQAISGARGLASFSGTFDARIAATFNLFDTGKSQRASERAELEWQASQIALSRAMLQARADLERANIRASSAQGRLAITQKSLELAQRNYQWAKARYEQGYALMVEVAEAQTKQIAARNQHIAAMVEQQIAHAELERSLGDFGE